MKNELLDILMDHDIIFQGKETRSELKKTQEFQLLVFIVQNEEISLKDLKDYFDENPELYLFSMEGDGLIVRDNNIIKPTKSLLNQLKK